MLFPIFNMSYKSYSKCLEEKLIMNKSDTTIATGEDIDFIRTYHCCFHPGVQESKIERYIVAHVVGDPGSSCWNPWPVR